jgi:hypothetical protein
MPKLAWEVNGVSVQTQVIVAFIMCALGLLSMNLFGLLIAIALGFFWLGPACAEQAIKCNRNPNWAFAIGCIFTLLGALAYWIYTGIVGVKK